ncbi:MAG: DUF1800 family protein [Verrucomicrobiota bacterium]
MLRTPAQTFLLLPLVFLYAAAQVPSAIGGSGLDLDGDGMSDLWEAQFQARGLLPNGDDDGDGKTNLFESQSGTDPFDPQSQLVVDVSRVDRINRVMDLTFDDVVGKRYQVRGSQDLESWQDLEGPFTGSGVRNINSYSSPTVMPKTFFARVDVQEMDVDGDGLTAYEELLLGFSDSNPYSVSSSSQNDYARAVEQFSNGQSFTLEGRTVSGQLPTPEEASRFLLQAGMGADYELIQQVAQTGFSSWIENEFVQPPNYHLPRVLSFLYTVQDDNGETLSISNFLWSWWDINMRGQDMLRQRTAYALSQIFVASMVGSDELEDSPWGLADYYDVLVRNSFGNFENLLYEVTYHPVMGLYLSHVRNRKANPVTNRFPDENYAREILQLFSIGLYELNQDGTRRKDPSGNDIPTYSNADIREFARIFTGLTYDGSNVAGIPYGLDPGDDATILNEAEFLEADPYFNNPMQVFEPAHDTGSKQLLSYTTVNGVFVNGLVPGGLTTDQDIQAALQNIFNHPNVGPFIGKQLIQRLVKSNPSPAYIRRVAMAFNDNGQGVRGDMKSVIRAILLDPEARNRGFLNDPTNGRLREPYMRYLHLCRAFNLSSSSGFYRNLGIEARMAFQQQPLAAPSVFNFYLPNHSPLGPLNAAGLVAPEFQITTASTTIATMNFWLGATFYGEAIQFDEDLGQYESVFDLETEYEIADSDHAALVDRFDLILTYGSMSSSAKNLLVSLLDQAQSQGFDSWDRVHLLLYLFVNSPEFSVLR